MAPTAAIQKLCHHPRHRHGWLLSSVSTTVPRLDEPGSLLSPLALLEYKQELELVVRGSSPRARPPLDAIPRCSCCRRIKPRAAATVQTLAGRRAATSAA